MEYNENEQHKLLRNQSATESEEWSASYREETRVMYSEPKKGPSCLQRKPSSTLAGLYGSTWSANATMSVFWQEKRDEALTPSRQGVGQEEQRNANKHMRK